LAWDSDFDPFRDDPDSTDLEGSSQLSSLLNPNLPMSSALGSEHFIHPGDEIIVPPSASSYSAGRAGFGFSGRGSVISEDANKAYNQSVHGAQEERLLDHPGFEFDADGNWVEGMQEPEMVRASSIQDSAPVMRDHIQPRSDNHYDFQFDDLPTINQDDVDMNNVEAFPIRQQAEEEEEEEEISSTVAASRVALNRHSRKKKVLPLDQQTSLRNSDLQDWDRNYLYNQTAALEQKSKGTSLAQARRNADFSVLRNFGGLGVVFWGMENYAPEELAFYTSPEFIESLRCPILSPAGKKRGHEDEQEDQARNVRQKMDDFGSEDLVENANDFGQTFDSIEVGREAETPLADIMSSTPWLVSGVASRAPSSRLVSVPFSPAPVPGPAILAVESQDFLSFVHAGVAQIRADAETTVEAVASVLDVDDDDGENDDNLAVEFGALLDPAVTTKSAAAQGFLQLLGLAQRKLLQVEQVEDFGEIEVRVL
jgi:meiotic recombination protein REC8